MKFNEPNAMAEIHEIRLRHYERGRKMTRDEEISTINARAREIAQNLGLAVLSRKERKV